MKTYKIMITFSSDPKEFWSGNISRYYFKYKKGDKVGLCGNSQAKRYIHKAAAINMCDKLHEIYPTALIQVGQLNTPIDLIGITIHTIRPNTDKMA